MYLSQERLAVRNAFSSWGRSGMNSHKVFKVSTYLCLESPRTSIRLKSEKREGVKIYSKYICLFVKTI
jgi:hypothetical protein